MTKARILANTADALSATSSTELGYLDGVTSDIQTQLNAKQPTVANVSDTEIGYLDGVTSAIQTQLNAKQAVVSGVDDTEIGYLNGVTSAIQTQLNAKAPLASPTFTGTVTSSSGKVLAISTTTVASGVDWSNSLLEVQGTAGAVNNPGVAWHAPGASAMTVFHPRGSQALQVGGNNGAVDTATKSIRNIFTSTSDPSGGVDGDVWIKYTA